MGPYLFIAMGAMYKVDIHRVGGMCPHIGGHRERLTIRGCGNINCV